MTLLKLIKFSIGNLHDSPSERKNTIKESEVVMLSGHNRVNTIRELKKFDGTIVYLAKRCKTLALFFGCQFNPKLDLVKQSRA